MAPPRCAVGRGAAPRGARLTVPPRADRGGQGFDGGSYRDPSARVFFADGRVYRALRRDALDRWRELAAAPLLGELMGQGRLVATELLDPAPPLPPGDWAGCLEHERVPFVSYPCEWSFARLRDGAVFVLDLLAELLAAGFTLRDATPLNVQWRGARPVFIDVPSIERWREGEPWLGYRQFCEGFLNPLLFEASRGVGLQGWLRGEPEGMTSADLAALLPLREKLRPAVIAHVLLHAKSQARFDRLAGAEVGRELAAAGFSKQLILANLRGLRRLVGRLEPRSRTSAWAGYGEDPGYSAADSAAKLEFVERALASRRRAVVLDLGSNTGTYSLAAAGHADLVVALDADRAAVDELYRRTRRDGENRVLALVADLVNPTPGIGWRNRERQPLLERARPDLALALALAHHLVIGRNVPIVELVDWLAELAPETILEIAPREDPRVQMLLGRRPGVGDDWSVARFDEMLPRRLTILRRTQFADGGRTLYHLRSRDLEGGP
ncbi:MAG TPA: class I SAM-dependent methyltransferase [Thermoanaerobaculia bacterium]